MHADYFQPGHPPVIPGATPRNVRANSAEFIFERFSFNTFAAAQNALHINVEKVNILLVCPQSIFRSSVKISQN